MLSEASGRQLLQDYSEKHNIWQVALTQSISHWPQRLNYQSNTPIWQSLQTQLVGT